MKVAALFSGGKDSTHAIFLAQSRGWDVKLLITMVPERGESYMFHVPNIHLCKMQAKAMGIPHIEWKTTGEKEKELDDLKKALEGHDVQGIITGAIASDYQHTRIDRICHELGLISYSPLWRWNQDHVLDDIVSAGFKVKIIGVYAEGLGEEWLGRELTTESLSALRNKAEKNRMNVSGEGGEFETLVVNGPNFQKRLEIIESETVWQGNRGEMIVKDARLANK